MLPLRILLIENDPAIAGKIRTALSAAEGEPFELECVSLLSEGFERLTKRETSGVLLDLSLPDSQGIATFEKLFAAAPDVPILILGRDAAAAQAKDAVSRGAQDYLLPDHLDSYSLPRALRNAIDRKAVEDALYVEKERA
ncbi:MAG: response regulator, partial [Candidatus Acidiferrales bacterium]